MYFPEVFFFTIIDKYNRKMKISNNLIFIIGKNENILLVFFQKVE